MTASASSSAPIDTLEPSASGVKYPDRQSLPGSASRNVPLLVQEIAPLVQPHSRVLEIAAGHGLLTATLAKQCREQGVEGVKWEAREADEELVRAIGETCANAGVEDAVEARAWEIDDQEDESKQSGGFDLAIIANLVHIVPWRTVQSLFEKLGRTIVKREVGSKVCVYGAFNEEGRFTSEGNERFDTILKSRNPAYGLRDIQSEIAPLAEANGLGLAEVRRLAAGNLLLVFERRQGAKVGGGL